MMKQILGLKPLRRFAFGAIAGLALGYGLQVPAIPAATAADEPGSGLNPTVAALTLAIASLAVDTEVSANGVAELKDSLRRLERRIAALEQQRKP